MPPITILSLNQSLLGIDNNLGAKQASPKKTMDTIMAHKRNSPLLITG